MGLVHEGEGQERAPRLSEVLFKGPTMTFAGFAPLPSNVEALEAALRFATEADHLVVLAGPSGWGKTHLQTAIAARLRHAGQSVRCVAAAEFLRSTEAHDLSGTLLLDDCQDVLGKPRMRTALRLVLERRARAGRPTLLAFTLPKVSRAMLNLLPMERQWRIAHLGAPSAQEREMLIEQMASSEALRLSPRLVQIVANHMHGNGRTLSGALKRLRLSGGVWTDASSTLRACALLDPFFVDNPAWDLRHKIARLAEKHRNRFARVQPTDLAIYTMLREAQFAEVEVARAMGIEPSAAYVRASRFAHERATDPIVTAYTDRFVELIVSSLAGE